MPFNGRRKARKSLIFAASKGHDDSPLCLAQPIYTTGLSIIHSFHFFIKILDLYCSKTDSFNETYKNHKNLIITMPPIEQLAAEQFAAQPHSTEAVGIFQPLMEIIKPAMGTVSAIVGGLFGLYLIFVIVRFYYERKKVKLLKNIRYDLDQLNQHFNLPYSKQKKPIPFISKLFSKFKPEKKTKPKTKKRKKK